MSEADRSYGLLSETSGIEETRNPARQRHLPAQAAADWLRDGWRDLMVRPGLSLAYGIAVFAVTAILIWSLLVTGRDYILFPAIAGYMIVAPLLAVGLYEKSRIIERGGDPTLRAMLLVRPRAGAQIFFTGLLLCLLMLLWMRAAVLIYALFFGVRPFPGLDHITGMLVATPTGWAMLVVGTLIGGLFAAFGFAISVFSIPMLLDRRTDTLTAMGTSMAMVWNNLTPMIAWGAIVLALFVLSVITGFLGFVIIFPLLGHATWHAYRVMR
jgi:uncharacterized membrane protein